MTDPTRDLKYWQWGVPPNHEKLSFPVAAATTLYGNSIAFTNSVGQLQGTTFANTGKVWGLIDRQVDNSHGLACAVVADVNQGIFWVPFCAADGFVESDIGAIAYAYDAASVCKTAGSLPPAGKVVAIAGIGSQQGMPNGYVAVAFGLLGDAI